MVAVSKYTILINAMEDLFKLQHDCWHNTQSKLPVKTLHGEKRFSNYQRKKFWNTQEKM